MSKNLRTANVSPFGSVEPGHQKDSGSILPSLSVCLLIQETLRIYPPTSRVYKEEEEKFAVDMGILNGDPKVWGSDVMAFWPARWAGISSEEETYIPFRVPKYVSSAKVLFGPWIIAMLIAALDRAIGNGFLLEYESIEDSIEGTGPFEGGREAYSTDTYTMSIDKSNQKKKQNISIYII